MKMTDLLLLGALGVGAYFLLKKSSLFGEGYAGGGGGYYTIDTNGTENAGGLPTGNITIGNGGRSNVVTSRQSWTNTSYGQPGQPSVNFAVNTLYQGVSANAPEATRNAAAAILSGAPPRVAAKIKAGKWY